MFLYKRSVLIVSSSQEGSGETTHMRRQTKAFDAMTINEDSDQTIRLPAALAMSESTNLTQVRAWDTKISTEDHGLASRSLRMITNGDPEGCIF